MRKNIFSAGLLITSLVITLSAGGCGKVKEDSDTIVLRVGNWEEYIDEGDWDEDETIDLEDGTEIIGENSMVRDFEDWYYENYGVKVEVEYSTFGTNEELYNQLTLGDTFDLVCPSEYMIMKLMSEDSLQQFSDDFYDTSDENNYYINGVSEYIENKFRQLEFGGKTLDKYMAGYMWGVLGVVYNPKYVTEEDASTWGILLNDKYYKSVTVKDSVRDAYFGALGILNRDALMDENFINSADYGEKLTDIMNDTNQETVDAVEDILVQIKDNVYSFETDSGKADMVTGKVVANMQWSGDGTYTMDQAEEDGIMLSYAVPEEGTNLWFDGWCMLKDGVDGDSEKQRAAEAFINFVSRPDNAIRNMYYIGYTSVIAGGDSDLLYEYADWCFGAEDDEEKTVDYPLGYFFSKDGNDEDYTLKVPYSERERQVYSSYPTENVLDRSAIMAYFDSEENKRINKMWTNVRCFDLKNIFE